jgi:hypothetical protein
VRVYGESVYERFAGKKLGTLWYYRELLKVFRQVGTNPLIEELDRVVTELERLSNVQQGNEGLH